MGSILETFTMVLALWIILLVLAIMIGYGRQFFYGTLSWVSYPVRSAWASCRTSLLFLLIGLVLGAFYAPVIRPFLGMGL